MSDEGLNQEFKEKVEDFRLISKTACAFANAFGGRITIGVKDNGTIVGVPGNEIDLLQQRLEGAIQVISPVPFHKIFTEDIESKKVIVIEVYQLGQGAFCTLGGVVYYRASNVNSRLEGRTLQDYMVSRHIKSFDESISSARLSDLAEDKVRLFLKKRTPDLAFNGKKLPEYLLSLGLAKQNGELRLQNTAVLFFAKEPAKFLPQNEVKLARFSGTKPINIIDSKYFSSDILNNLKDAEEFIARNTRVAFKIAKLERQEVPEYPAIVIREALVNALTHRDYFSSDAVQVNIFDDIDNCAV
jgi:ATP-dependent DNA helicase RecG